MTTPPLSSADLREMAARHELIADQLRHQADQLDGVPAAGRLVEFKTALTVFGVSDSTLRRKIRNGDLRAIKRFGRWMVDLTLPAGD